MAKRKKSINIFNLPKDEVVKASTNIIKKTSNLNKARNKEENSSSDTIHNEPTKNLSELLKTPNKAIKAKGSIVYSKRKFLYVDEFHHQKAKTNASKKGMKLQEYIAWLILNDSPK